jgi:ABC-type phosphate/phosphonate transport system permease subunit
MPREYVWRAVSALVAAYAVNAVLVGGSEAILEWAFPEVAGRPPLSYFVIDVITQCLYTVFAGYVCYRIARSSRPLALFGLIGVGVIVGAAFLRASWEKEPHWYGITLLAAFPLCAWIGWALAATRNER